MTHAEKLARTQAITDSLREIDTAIGDEPPTDQALRIIGAIKRLRDSQPSAVASLSRRDYMAEVQERARAAWMKRWRMRPLGEGAATGPQFDAVAGIDTPLGRLKLVTWRRLWSGAIHQDRIVWCGEYYLNGDPITVREIKAAGLSQRQTTRNRKKKDRTE